MTHPQLDALRKSEEAAASGDMEGYLALHHDDCVVHIPGRSSFAGDYTGKDTFLSLIAAMTERISPTGFENLALFADDEYGVVLSRFSAARGDRTLEGQIVFVKRFRDGKVSEMWAVPFDQYARDEWMA